VDDGFAFTRWVKVKSVMTKVKVAFIHVGFKVLLISAYNHGKPSCFIVIKVSMSITTKFQYHDDLYGLSWHISTPHLMIPNIFTLLHLVSSVTPSSSTHSTPSQHH
jgi:hypothetical protein